MAASQELKEYGFQRVAIATLGGRMSLDPLRYVDLAHGVERDMSQLLVGADCVDSGGDVRRLG